MKAIIWDFNKTLYNPDTQKLYNGAKELLENCSKRYKQAIVTAALLNPNKRRNLIKKINIEKYFEQIVINIKTPKIFSTLCDQIYCSSKDTYVIGDGYLKEISAGNQLNMKTIWIDRKGTSKLKEKILRLKYWKKISCLSELKTILL